MLTATQSCDFIVVSLRFARGTNPDEHILLADMRLRVICHSVIGNTTSEGGCRLTLNAGTIHLTQGGNNQCREMQ